MLMSLKANPTPEILLNAELNLVISLHNNKKHIASSLKFIFDKIRETFPYCELFQNSQNLHRYLCLPGNPRSSLYKTGS